MKTNHKQHGFTIVELLIMIAVITILAGIVIFAFGSWRQRTAVAEVRSALSSVADGMKNARNFDNAFPTSIPTDVTINSGVTVTYISGTSSTYCVEGVSVAVPTVKMFVSDKYQTPQYGTCAGGVIVPGAWQITMPPSGTSDLVFGYTGSGWGARVDLAILKPAVTNLALGTTININSTAGCTELTILCGTTVFQLRTTGPLEMSIDVGTTWTTTNTVSMTTSSAGWTYQVRITPGNTSPVGTVATFEAYSASVSNPQVQANINGGYSKVIFTKN